MYVGWCAAMCAEGFVLVGPAVQFVVLCALEFVSGSPLDKFKFDLPAFIQQFMLSFANIM